MEPMFELEGFKIDNFRPVKESEAKTLSTRKALFSNEIGLDYREPIRIVLRKN